MIYLGIDLGTTFSLAAHVNSQSVPTLFPDALDANEFRTPSVVHIGNEGVLVGNPLERLLEDDPGLAHMRFVKLTMGVGAGVFLDHRRREWRPEALSALILRKLLQDVTAFSAEEIGGVVVTVPANFNDAQRRATFQAAVMAGLRNITLVEEPVAAATYYGFDSADKDQTLFVYDFGGGTFDATVLQTASDGLYAIATEGHHDLGGKNIDEAIMGRVADTFQKLYGNNPLSDPVAAMAIRQFCVDTKLRLAAPGKGQVRKTLLLAGRTLDFSITRTEFEALAAPFVDRTMTVSERCLQSAGLSWGMVDKVLLTGGSSLLPLVQRRMAEESNKTADAIISRQPHQAVAYGAAIVARSRLAQEAGRGGGNLVPVSAYHLGIRVRDEKGQASVKVLVKRNTPLPAQATHMFFTHRAEQERMVVEVVQTRELATGDVEENSLGRFSFGPLLKPRLNYPVRISLAYDQSGLVRVQARDEDTGQVINEVLGKNEEGLTDELIEQRGWVREARVNG